MYFVTYADRARNALQFWLLLILINGIEVLIIQQGHYLGLHLVPLTFLEHCLAYAIGAGILLWDLLCRSFKNRCDMKKEKKRMQV